MVSAPALSRYLILTLTLLTGIFQLQGRTWTSRDGQTLEGELIAVSMEGAHIRSAANSQDFVIPLDYFCTADQQYIREQAPLLEASKRQAGQSSKQTSGNFPEGGLKWPDKVSSPRNFEVKILEENTATATYRYQSGHFIFTSDIRLARKVVAEFASIFEATYNAIEAMPLSWNPQPPPGGYSVRLFSERADYYAAGGTINSGGVYIRQRRTIMVPLQSLGVKKSSSGVTLDGASNDTLIHEITHQVHHDWLSSMPKWMIEGAAEYMEKVPYDRGTFSFSRLNPLTALRRNADSSGEVLVIPLEKLMSVKGGEWNQTLRETPDTAKRYYYSSFLLFYYFAHLDGAGDGQRLWNYLRAVENNKSIEEATALLLDQRDHRTLTEDFRKAYRTKKVKIKISDD